jgi:glycosyltransferase involved in cell wall biosynthesis
MKKILHIPNFYPPHTGGIEDVCYSIVSILKEDPSVSQKVICFSGSKIDLREHIEGIEVLRIGAALKIASQFVSFSYRAGLKKMIDSFAPDFIHFHAPNPYVAYFLLDVLPPQTSLIVHWHSDIVAQKLLYPLVKKLEMRLLERANVIIATSPNYISESAPLQREKDKVCVIQNVINPDKFQLDDTQRELVATIKKEYNNKKIVLFVGRHVPYKGISFLLEAANEMREDCVILVGGKGPQTKALKAMVKTPAIHFIGRIPDELLNAYYYAADVFAFPSVTKNEAFGVALAQAMYCRTPAVTFTINGSGVNWVSIHNETGIEVPNSDALSLAKALDYLLFNNNIRDKYAENARKRIEDNFVLEKIKKSVYQLYNI